MYKEELKSLITDDILLEKVEGFIEAEVKSELQKLALSFNKIFFTNAIIGKDIEIKYSGSILGVSGYSSEEIEGLPNKLASIVHEDDRLRIKNNMLDFIAGNCGNEYSISYRIVNKDDKIVWLTENLQAEFNKESTLIGYHSVIVDITSIKNEGKELEEVNSSLIDLDKLKDKFISVISHDLKSPYTTILGFSEILMNDDTLHEKEKLEYISYIYDGSVLQLKLIEHLLDWSRLRTGRTKIENQRLNLRNVISTAVSKQTGEAVRKNIEIKQIIHANSFINSDEKQFQKAISEILNNAIKYSQQDSDIIISADMFKDGTIEVVIKDNGVGISKVDQDKIFRLDQKFSKNGTNGEAGSGMGLIVTEEIMDKLKGEVWFYSTEGEGSEFHITVPEAKNQIMIVNPSENYLKIKSKLLSATISGYEILTLKSGFEALEIIEKELPTIIIVKDNMPLMNGVEVAKTIRNKDKYYSVSIIVLTPELNEETQKKYEPYIVDHIISETTNDNDLINTIGRLLK
ncbi:MAG: ATP-binding protein [Bacteroidota bacterium]